MNKSKRGPMVRGLALCAALAALCAMTPRQSAGAVGAYTAERFSAAPPPEVSAAVREALSNDGIRVQGPDGPLCEIWLRKAIPVNASPSNELGVAFGEFAEGTLAAVVRFPAEVIDYRKQRVKAGVYTLRYALNPVNGNHQGVAPQRFSSRFSGRRRPERRGSFRERPHQPQQESHRRKSRLGVEFESRGQPA
ncbi:MAG TPA: hypothetical protein VEU31_00600, partial [Candidatus Acidoferrales bacterium]|nr:hypothetical protein [Candidatus Acidoferrales bacterium]